MPQRAIRTFWAIGYLVGAGLIAVKSSHAQVAIPHQSKIIDEHMKKTWADAKVTPAKRAGDNEYMRRVFIDVLGRIPTPEEIRDFERDSSTNKRANLVRRILTADAYKIRDGSGRFVKGDDGKEMVFEYTR